MGIFRTFVGRISMQAGVGGKGGAAAETKE